MKILIVLIVSAAINSATILAIASECTTGRDIDAFRSYWAALRSHDAPTSIYATALPDGAPTKVRRPQWQNLTARSLS